MRLSCSSLRLQGRGHRPAQPDPQRWQQHAPPCEQVYGRLSTPSSLVKADEVNQILIPADVRISFGVEAYTEFNISFDDETKTYILVKVIPACAICEETEHIVFVSDKSVHNQYLCQNCINDIAEFLKKKQAKIL